MKQRFSLITILFCLLFLWSFIPQNMNQEIRIADEDIEIVDNPHIQAYIEHGPIYIDGDSNLTAWGFPGMGSEIDPFRIEGYNFTMNETAIYVVDISLHLLISGCLIQSAGSKISVGIYFENVTSGRVENCSIIDRSFGISITQSDSCTISDVEITGTANNAINIASSTNCKVIDSYIHHVSSVGIYDSSSLTLVSNTVIHNTAAHGIYSVGENITVDSCEIFRASSMGIRNEAWYSIFNNNTIYHCGTHGIYEYAARYDTFTDNTIFGNPQIGIYFIVSRYSDIIGNTIFGNSWGIYFDDAFTGDMTVYDNAFGWQTSNVMDDSDYTNIYDNGIDTGNAWSDFTGTPFYSVDGMGGGTDHYPTYLIDSTAPAVNTGPEDILMSDLEVSQLSWNLATEDFPKAYTILINGSGSPVKWDGKDIEYTLQELNPGVYNYTLWLEDCAGNYLSDTLFIEVYGFALDSPSDIIVESGTTGNSISWFATAGDQVYYQIYANGSLELTANWIDWTILFGVDNLCLGVHEIEIRVYNSTGHYLSDIVFVDVVDSYDPVINNLGVYYLELDSLLTLSWTIVDNNPSELILWKNNTIYLQLPWDFPIFSIEIVGDEIGTWNYTLEIIDGAGRTASDTAIVVVRNSTPMTTTTTTTTTITATPPETFNETQINEIKNQILTQYVLILAVGGLAVLSLMFHVSLVRRIGKKE